MNKKLSLSPYSKYTVAGLLMAAVGVVIQIFSGAPYPTNPPVFFILLIPAALTVLTRFRLAPVIVVLGGVLLLLGLFASGASIRLIHSKQPGDSIGLWIQMLAIVFACVTGIIATVQNYRTKASLNRQNHKAQGAVT